jgi:hypothetical protein
VNGLVISLSLALYIIIAGGLYYKDRKDMAILERYLNSQMPVSDNMLKIAFLLMFFCLPILQIISWVRTLLGKKDELENYEDDPDMRAFIEEYYPEKMYEVEQATIVLDSILEINGFIERLNGIFDEALDPIEQERVIHTARKAEKDIDKNCQANVTYEGTSVPLIFKISRNADEDENFKIDIFTRSFVMDKIDSVMTAYVAELEQAKVSE